LQSLPLYNDQHANLLEAAPNPKPSAADKRSYGSLASLYTAFSTDFARYALELCSSEGHRTILDPFAGMGTLGEAGRSMPISLLLNDLNPFASMSCAFRSAAKSEISAAIKRVSASTLWKEARSEFEAFDYAVRTRAGDACTPAELLALTDDEESRSALLDIHLVSLIRISTHRRLQGSNPTWTKRSTNDEIDSATFETARAAVLANAAAYASRLHELDDDFSAKVTCGNVAGLNWEDCSIDAIVTSPPYPNRTDYIRHYLPAAELLLGGDSEAERLLREAQIGTPLIRQALPKTQLPDSVEDLIQRVRTHGSYASERYYAKGFQYYFDDMSSTFARMHRWLKPGGLAIIVVQDAYYKEMRVPVADLLTDIAGTHGLVPESRKDFPVRHALSRLSATARASAPARVAVESAMLLRRQ
jgi:DNA modification methylase